MRSITVVIVTFFFSIMSLITLLTVDSYLLQKDEITKAMDYALEQTMRESISDPDEIAIRTVENFKSQIRSKRGTLTVYVLYADENIIDLSISFSYTQYNGTKKEIEERKTIIRDWEDGKKNESIIRMISAKYLNETPEKGGLKENSIWKTNSLLQTVLEKEKVGGKWEGFSLEHEIKKER